MIRNKFFEEGSSGGYASIKAPKNFDLMWKKILAFEEKSGLSLDSPLTKDQYALMFNSMRIRHVTTFVNYKSLLMTYIRFLIANDALPSEQEDVLDTFEGMMRTLFKNVLNVDIPNPLPRMSWYDAMDNYGSDKPDIRFGMKIHEITGKVQGKGFSVFDSVEYVGAISVDGAAEYTRKQIDELTEWVKRPQVGAKGLVYIKYNQDGTFKSSVDKFYSQDELKGIAEYMGSKPGDMILVLCGSKRKTQTMLGVLRIEMGNRLGLRDPYNFAPLWIVDFPLLEWDDETQRFYAMHHPFTAPKPEHMDLFYSDRKEDLEKVCANAYDFVLNGTELGGGSIRIHNAEVQQRMFEVLGISREDAEYKFGFIINAFKFGAPPHGGLAFGFDRVCALFGGQETIRDYIAFPKNNQGRDVLSVIYRPGADG